MAGSAVLAGAALLWATRAGPGLSPDSLKYLLLARSLAAGGGFQYLGAPATHYPPGYPLLLAVTGAGGPTALECARLVQASLFALNAALVAVSAVRVAHGAAWTGPLALLTLVASPMMFRVHAMVFSEAAFIALALGAGLLLSSRLGGAGMGTLVAAALCLAGALLVRYAGLALSAAAILTILVWSPRGRRLRDAAVMFVISAGPLTLWLTRNAIVAGSATNRFLALHPVTGSHLEQFAQAEAALWGSGAFALLALVAVLATAGSSFGRRHGESDRSPSTALRGFAVLAWVCSVAMLVVSISLYDFDTPVDFRLLAPTHAFAVVLVAAGPAHLRQRGWIGISRVASAAIVLFATAHLHASAVEAADFRAAGDGFDSLVWRASPTVASLRLLPAATPVITNVPELVAFFVHPNATGVPATVERTSLRPRAQFERELAETCAAVKRGAVVAYLGNAGWAWEVPTDAALAEACSLRVSRRFPDGLTLVAERR